MKNGVSPELQPRMWLIILGAILLVTCIGAPIGLTILIWEVVRVRTQGRRHKDILFQNLFGGLDDCLDIVSRGPKDRPPGVQVAPSIRADSLRRCIDPISLSDRDRVVAIWEPEDAGSSSPRILVTNLRSWVYSGLTGQTSPRMTDTPNSQMRSVVAVKEGKYSTLWINKSRVVIVPDERYWEAIRSMATWVRLAVGHTMPEAIRCPGCKSDDVDCAVESVSVGDLVKAAGIGAIAGLTERYTINVRDNKARKSDEKYWNLILQRLVATCPYCGKTWKIVPSTS